jgi:translation elongation factor EF-G
VYSDANGGTIATGRLFSGKIQKADRLHLVDALAETIVSRVSVDMGSFREEVNSIPTGN